MNEGQFLPIMVWNASSAIVLAVWRASYEAGLTALVIWAVCRAFPKPTPSVRCWLWRIVLLKFVLTFAFSLGQSAVQTHQASAIAAQRAAIHRGLAPALGSAPAGPSASARATVPASDSAPTQAAPASAAGKTPAVAASAPVQTAPVLAEPTVAPATVRKPIDLSLGLDIWHASLVLMALGMLYLCGVGICVIRLVKLGIRTRQFVRNSCVLITDASTITDAGVLARRLGLHAAPRLLESADVASSLLISGRHPAIVLPELASDTVGGDERRMMLAHELTHFRRRDLAWSWVSTLAHVLFFFHPLVWLARREEDLACEMACDALTVAAADATRARYGALLLRTATAGRGRSGRAVAALGIASDAGHIRQRLVALQEHAPISTRHLRLLTGTAAAVIAVALIPWRVAAAPKIMLGDYRPAEVRGRIINSPENVPGANSEIELTPISGQSSPKLRLRGASTDVDGYYRVPGLDPGTYRVSARDLNATRGVASQLEQMTITVKPGETRTLADIGISRRIRVVGRIYDEKSGQSVSGVQVWGDSGDVSPSLATNGSRTDSDGRYEIYVPAGSAAICLRYGTYMSVGNNYTGAYCFPGTAGVYRKMFQAEPGRTYQIDFPVKAEPVPVPQGSLAPLTGTVVGPGGRVVAHAKVFLASATASEDEVVTRSDDKGHFRFDRLTPRWAGTVCNVRASGPDSDDSLISHPVSVTIPAHASATPVSLSLVSGLAAPATGRVVDPNGRPVAGVIVKLIDWSSHCMIEDRVVTDADGKYRFGHLWPDLIAEIEGEKDTYGSGQRRVVGSVLRDGQRQAVAAIVLVAGSEVIAGQIVTASGRPVPNQGLSATRGGGGKYAQGHTRMTRGASGWMAFPPDRWCFN